MDETAPPAVSDEDYDRQWARACQLVEMGQDDRAMKALSNLLAHYPEHADRTQLALAIAHDRAGIIERRLGLCKDCLGLKECALILTRVNTVERLPRRDGLPAHDIFLHDIAGDTRLDLYLIRAHDLPRIDMREWCVLAQNIHRLDGRRTRAPLLTTATAGQKSAQRKDHSDKNAKTFSAFKQIKNLLFPIPCTNIIFSLNSFMKKGR